MDKAIMKLIEISYKKFTANPKTFAILESYSDPTNELAINFRQSTVSQSTFYATVSEKMTDIPVLEAVFTLRAGIIDIGNIIPADHPKHNNLVHTSLGVQYNGVDMGKTAIRWLFRQIKDFATSRGFEVKRIVSDTRYTGARAKNNPGVTDAGDVKSFDVGVNVKEAIYYHCATDQFMIQSVDK